MMTSTILTALKTVSTDLWRVSNAQLSPEFCALTCWIWCDVLHVSVYIFNLHRIAGKNFQEDRTVVVHRDDSKPCMTPSHCQSHSILIPKDPPNRRWHPQVDTSFRKILLYTCHVIVVHQEKLNRENGKKFFDIVIFSAIRNTYHIVL